MFWRVPDEGLYVNREEVRYTPPRRRAEVGRPEVAAAHVSGPPVVRAMIALGLGMALDLFEEFKGLVRALSAGGVDHAVVGALAVAIHGAPRATTDIDLLVEGTSVDRALEIAQSCGFGFPAMPMKFRDGTEIHRVSKIESGETLTLDYLLVNETLAPIWASRQRINTDFGVLTVVSREALIRMKIAAGRPRDLGDVEALSEMDR